MIALPRLKGPRLSLRFFLIVVMLAGLVAGTFAKHVRDRRRVISDLQSMAPDRTRELVEYDFQFDATGSLNPAATSRVPKVLLAAFDHSFFHEIVGVNLDGSHVRINDMEKLLALPNLKRLDVEYNQISPGFLRTLTQLTKLERLDLQATGIQDADLKYVSTLKELRILLVSGREISDEGLVHLEPLVNLEHVAFRKCSITGNGLAHLSTARLRSLDLRRCPLDDASVVHVARFSQLERLELSGTNLSDQSVPTLAGLTGLVELTLPQTVSESSVALLTHRLTRCVIKRER